MEIELRAEAQPAHAEAGQDLGVVCFRVDPILYGHRWWHLSKDSLRNQRRVAVVARNPTEESVGAKARKQVISIANHANLQPPWTSPGAIREVRVTLEHSLQASAPPS